MQFIQNENKYLSKIGPELDPVANGIEKFLLDSGKRLRPLFAYVGFLATGSLSRVEIIRAISSLELIHACALIHDDVMDGSTLGVAHQVFISCLKLYTQKIICKVHQLNLGLLLQF